MADKTDIPAGFTESTWKQLSDQQKALYQQAAENTNTQTEQIEEMQKRMVKDARKKAVSGMVFSSILSFLPRLLRSFFNK